MKVVVNNIKLHNTKKTMDCLLACVKDKIIDIKTRNEYYSEYLKLAKEYLILNKEN